MQEITSALIDLVAAIAVPVILWQVSRWAGTEMAEKDRMALSDAIRRGIATASADLSPRDSALKVMDYLRRTSPKLIQRMSDGEGPILERVKASIAEHMQAEASAAANRQIRREAAAPKGEK